MVKLAAAGRQRRPLSVCFVRIRMLLLLLLLLWKMLQNCWCAVAVDEQQQQQQHEQYQQAAHHKNHVTQQQHDNQHDNQAMSPLLLEEQHSSLHIQQEREPRIVGGTRAKRNKYPYYVRIDSLTTGRRGICGGVLVARDLVLTAGHCVKPQQPMRQQQQPPSPPPPALKIVVNAYTRSKRINRKLNQFGRRVQSLKRHPKYNQTTWENDVVLLKLKTPIPARPSITGSIQQPVAALNFNATLPQVGSDLIAVGMGRMAETGNLSFVLRDVTIAASDSQECVQSYKSIGRIVRPSIMLCAGALGKSPCKGDSGGPLLWMPPPPPQPPTPLNETNNATSIRKEPAAVPLLVGIVSWGAGCGRLNYPSVHVRISGIQDWLKPAICNMTRFKPSWCPKNRPTTTTTPPVVATTTTTTTTLPPPTLPPTRRKMTTSRPPTTPTMTTTTSLPKTTALPPGPPSRRKSSTLPFSQTGEEQQQQQQQQQQPQPITSSKIRGQRRRAPP